jgi:hypothetical protein
LIYVVGDRARAGSGLLRLAFDDLEQLLAQLAERGIAYERIDVLAGGTRKVVFSDPDGNMVAFFEDPGGET